MYLPARFAGDEQAGRELIAAHPFASLIAAGGDSLLIDHLPIILKDNKLWGHLAAANPHSAILNGEIVTAIFHGPHAFVDHRWYTHPEQQVPTWNYAVAHVRGRLQVHRDYDTLMDILDMIQGAVAPAESWKTAAPGELKKSLEKSIVGFSIEIESIQTKLKLSQNRSEKDPERVMKALEKSARQEDQAVAKLMRKFTLG